MATIEFKGFPEKRPERGPWTVVEPHAVKDDAGKWVTKARTFHRVWLPDGVDFLPEGELVTVKGKQKTVGYTKDGEQKWSLVVYADSVENAGRSSKSAEPSPVVVPGEPENDVPF